MAKAIPNPESPRTGGSPGQRSLSPHEHSLKHGGLPEPSALDAWGTDDLMPREGEDLGSEPQGLLSPREPSGLEPAGGEIDAGADPRLLNENLELRGIIADLQQELEAAHSKSEHEWTERQKEYENLLDEKTDTIRSLHLKLQEYQELHEKLQRPPTPKEEELLAMSEDLERERCQLQQERREVDEEKRQLKEENDSSMEDARRMEMQMARERADLARQKNELQRLNEEIRQELDRLERDRGLSDRLQQLRHRHLEAMKGKSSMMGPPQSKPNPSPKTQLSIDLDSEAGKAAEDDPKKKKDSGLFRRMFGQGG